MFVGQKRKRKRKRKKKKGKRKKEEREISLVPQPIDMPAAHGFLA